MFIKKIKTYLEVIMPLLLRRVQVHAQTYGEVKYTERTLGVALTVSIRPMWLPS